MKIYLNGRILEEKNARINALDRGFLFGDGLFETMRSYRGRIFLLNEHLDRLFSSAKFLKMKILFSRKKLADACYETIEANKIKDCRLRLTISRGKFFKSSGLKPQSDSTLLITVSRIDDRILDEPEQFKIVRGNFFIAKNFPLAKHKTLSYLPYLFAYDQARGKKADDALLFTEDGFLLETSRANIFLVKNDVLKTPSLNLPILPGITRQKVIEIAGEIGIQVREGEFLEKDLLNADGAFLTNSVIEIAIIKNFYQKHFKDQRAIDLIKNLFNFYREQALA